MNDLRSRLTGSPASGDNLIYMPPPLPSDSGMRFVPILDVGVHTVTMKMALATLREFAHSGSAHHVVTLDASMCVAARSDERLRQIICEAELVTPDSAGVLWAARRSGAKLAERVSGVELTERLCEMSAAEDLALYFLGAAPGIADEAAAQMQKRFPGCRIVGTQHGYFQPEDDAAVADAIVRARPDVLIVALGIPKQEKWIADHRAALGTPIMIGVGGTLDVLSGRVPRAPALMRTLCLEWLYRVGRDPSKLGKVMTLPRFVGMVLLSNMRRPDAESGPTGTGPQGHSP